jgi:hypothetical protein
MFAYLAVPLEAIDRAWRRGGNRWLDETGGSLRRRREFFFGMISGGTMSHRMAAWPGDAIEPVVLANTVALA